MALVPFRVSGAAADQTLEHRLFQIGVFTIQVDQDNKSSGSLQNVGHGRVQTDSQSGKLGSSKDSAPILGPPAEQDLADYGPFTSLSWHTLQHCLQQTAT